MRWHHYLLLLNLSFCEKLLAQLQPDSAILHNTLSDIATTVELSTSDLNSQEESAPSSVLLAGRNYTLNVYGLSFYQVRYRQRGYEYLPGNSFINGVPINSLENNVVQYNLFSGLNNMIPVEETAEQLAPNNFSFGGLGNHFQMSSFAGKRSHAGRIGYAYSNRNYNHRVYGNYYTGYNRKGWAFALGFNGRYSREGNVPGTYYEGGSLLFSVDRKWKDHTLNLTILYSDYENGRQNAAVKETFGLTHTNLYNPAWGWQSGKKRNANVIQGLLPTILLSHKSFLSERTYLSSGVGVTFGKVSRTGLEWYHAPDPRPDYYRYLPSYWQNSDKQQAEELTNLIEQNPNALQIQWDNLYAMNQSQSDGRALYILSKQNTDYLQFNVGSAVHTVLGKRMHLSAGFQLQSHNMHYYQSVADLLGAKYWVNVNSFIHTSGADDVSIIQNDIDNPDRQVLKNELFGYNYRMHIMQIKEWLQWQMNFRRWEIYAGGELFFRQMRRNGLVRNGLYPDLSKGKDDSPAFYGVNAKAGATYKINGRHYTSFSAAVQQLPPTVDMVYVSARTRDLKYENVSLPIAHTAEFSYIWNAPSIKARVNLYYTQIENAAESRFFYDDVHQNFATYYLHHIGKRHYGIETFLDWNFLPDWNFTCTAAFSESYYSNRPRLIVTSEVNRGVILDETVYLKKYRIPNTPQQIIHSAIQYRSPNAWFVSFSGNVFFDRWAAVNPMRRTSYLTQDIDPVTQKELMASVTRQEKLPNGATLDVFSGYSLFVGYDRQHRNRRYIDFLFSGNNLIGNRNIIAYGFEQMRMDLRSYNVDRYPNKYSYAMGRNYYIGMSLRF